MDLLFLDSLDLKSVKYQVEISYICCLEKGNLFWEPKLPLTHLKLLLRLWSDNFALHEYGHILALYERGCLVSTFFFVSLQSNFDDREGGDRTQLWLRLQNFALKAGGGGAKRKRSQPEENKTRKGRTNQKGNKNADQDMQDDDVIIVVLPS